MEEFQTSMKTTIATWLAVIGVAAFFFAGLIGLAFNIAGALLANVERQYSSSKNYKERTSEANKALFYNLGGLGVQVIMIFILMN